MRLEKGKLIKQRVAPGENPSSHQNFQKHVYSSTLVRSFIKELWVSLPLPERKLRIRFVTLKVKKPFLRKITSG